MKVLGIIPARAGSKGLPRKNIRLLRGRTLIERAYDCATEAQVVDRIILSTDDEQIAEHGNELGIEVPFMRPHGLAQDTTPMIDVVLHSLDKLSAEQYHPDLVLLLQPTSPLRQPHHITRALELVDTNDSVCSVYPVPKEFCPHFLLRLKPDGFLDFFMADGSKYTRRQDVPQAYKRDGTIYLTRTSVLLGKRTFYGDKCVPLIVSADEALTIDTHADWNEAESRLSSIEN